MDGRWRYGMPKEETLERRTQDEREKQSGLKHGTSERQGGGEQGEGRRFCIAEGRRGRGVEQAAGEEDVCGRVARRDLQDKSSNISTEF